MKKLTAFGISIFFVLVGLTACSEGKGKGVDTGIVIKSSGKYVTVFEDDGETDKHSVSRSVVRKCSVGERWPDCKK